MSQISDDTKLSQLSIPGSHGSLTQESAKCQSDEMFCLTQRLTLGQQLGAGVRFIDLTIKQNDLDSQLFECYHGTTNLKIDLISVLDIMKEFLSHVPTETIIVSLQMVDYFEEIHSLDHLKRTLNTYMQNNPWLIYQGNFANGRIGTPNLASVRGKIFLLNYIQYFTEGRKIWLGSRSFRIDDSYRIGTTTVYNFPPNPMIKFTGSMSNPNCDDESIQSFVDDLINHILEAAKLNNPDLFYMTWTKYDNKCPCRSIVDKTFHQQLYKKWSTKNLFGIGITAMDLLDKTQDIYAYIKNIIRFNMKRGMLIQLKFSPL